MREKEVEQKLVKAVKLAGGFCIKFTSPDLTECRTDWFFFQEGE